MHLRPVVGGALSRHALASGRRAAAVPPMPRFETIRTPTFRLACVSGGAFAFCVLMLFGLIQWQAGVYETNRVDWFVQRKLHAIAAGDTDAEVKRLAQAAEASALNDAYFGLFGPSGTRREGNIPRLPADLKTDGVARRVDGNAVGGARPLRMAAVILPDGSTLVIGRDVAELEELQNALLRALEIGVLPAVLLSLAVGAWLGGRAARRVRAIRLTIERIMTGNLQDRLVVTDQRDDFNALAASVNSMLDEIERLLEEIAGVGDDIAHDLRTPLTRVRTRLERAKLQATTREELVEAVESAIVGLDQALGIITALLRIAEIEDGRRRAAFGDVDLAALARDIAELYEPIAEGHGVALTVDALTRLSVHGDRDLMIEAIANVVDNAVKFTPRGGAVSVAVFTRDGKNVIRIADTGSGIPREEREAVMKRFYRSDKSRHHLGSGLGLGVVQAIVTLHGFTVAIGDAAPGCIFEIICPPASHARERLAMPISGVGREA